mmetsp:Transcript_24486/g.70299  ORF Transcript_24486/g.70299 Transcript_24486/m.70299 type:complete len:85 (+) Transcript_24486:1485-1739(+)
MQRQVQDETVPRRCSGQKPCQLGCSGKLHLHRCTVTGCLCEQSGFLLHIKMWNFPTATLPVSPEWGGIEETYGFNPGGWRSSRA